MAGSDTDSEYGSDAPGPSTKKKIRTEIVHKKCVATYSGQDFIPSEDQSTDLSRRDSLLQIVGDVVIEYDNNQTDVDDENHTIDPVQRPRQSVVRLNNGPKSSATRGREFRARKALLKAQSKRQEPDPIVETVEGKRARSAEATRRWRKKKKGDSESSKKQAKTAAQRMREYRKRKKLAKKMLLNQQSDQDSDAVFSTSQVNQRAGPSTINGISAELLDIVIEYDNNQMEVDNENPTPDYDQKLKQTTGVRLKKAPKTSAERAREFRARKALLKQQEPDAIAKSAEATRQRREQEEGVSDSSKEQAKSAAERMREYRRRKKLAKKILLKQQSDQELDSVSTSSQVNERAGPKINSISAELTRRGSLQSCNKLKLQKRIEVPPHFLAPAARKTEEICPVCLKTFATQNTLERHLLLHSRTKHTCEVCKKEFSKPELMEKHFQKHHDTNLRKFPCNQCDKRFKSASNLYQHKAVHLEVKPYSCELCNKSFINKWNFLKHQSKKRCKQPVRGPLVCNVCHKEFQKEALLKSHLVKHTTEKPYQCDMCGMDFKYKSGIARHLQWHTNTRPYSCNICNKKFTHSGLIKPHMRVHTGEKPFQCPICNKFFAHKHNMERHKINHGRIKRLVCDICNKKFPKESRLIYHMRTHTNEKHFACHICDKRFAHKQYTITHYERKHPGYQYTGTETDAKVALKVWDKVQQTLQPHFDMYQQPEEIVA